MLMSVGKYNTKLYHKGNGQHSSCIGACISFILFVIFMVLAGSNMLGTLRKDDWNHKEDKVLLKDWEYAGNTL